MKTGRTVVITGMLLCAAAAPVASQTPREQLLITADELAAKSGAPNLVLLHVGEEANYPSAHLPGARMVSTRMLSAPRASQSDLALQMPDAATLEAALEGLGISDDSEIVVYMADEWVTPAARVVFTLDYAGLGARTRLLAGGLAAWRAAGGAVSGDVPPARTGSLSGLRIRDDRIVDKAFILSHLDRDGFAIIDARAQAFYDGVREDGGRRGHIPGAGSAFWSTLYDDGGNLKPDAELRAIFAAAGVEPGDIVVGYCHIGQYATAMLFAARVAGFDVRLYDGSFQEWSLDPSTPLELPKEQRP